MMIVTALTLSFHLASPNQALGANSSTKMPKALLPEHVISACELELDAEAVELVAREYLEQGLYEDEQKALAVAARNYLDAERREVPYSLELRPLFARGHLLLLDALAAQLKSDGVTAPEAVRDYLTYDIDWNPERSSRVVEAAVQRLLHAIGPSTEEPEELEGRALALGLTVFELESLKKLDVSSFLRLFDWISAEIRDRPQELIPQVIKQIEARSGFRGWFAQRFFPNRVFFKALDLNPDLYLPVDEPSLRKFAEWELVSAGQPPIENDHRIFFFKKRRNPVQDELFLFLHLKRLNPKQLKLALELEITKNNPKLRELLSQRLAQLEPFAREHEAQTALKAELEATQQALFKIQSKLESDQLELAKNQKALESYRQDAANSRDLLAQANLLYSRYTSPEGGHYEVGLPFEKALDTLYSLGKDLQSTWEEHAKAVPKNSHPNNAQASIFAIDVAPRVRRVFGEVFHPRGRRMDPGQLSQVITTAFSKIKALPAPASTALVELLGLELIETVRKGTRYVTNLHFHAKGINHARNEIKADLLRMIDVDMSYFQALKKPDFRQHFERELEANFQRAWFDAIPPSPDELKGEVDFWRDQETAVSTCIAQLEAAIAEAQSAIEALTKKRDQLQAELNARTSQITQQARVKR